MQSKFYSVSQVNGYIKKLLEKDVFLRDVFVEAEISNFKAQNHFYFTIKDEFAALNCVMFSSYASAVDFKPENGMKVLLYGYISVFEKTGQYQLYVQSMEVAGKGNLYLAFEKLKERLDRAGLFDAKHKRPIPKFPKCVAVVTSPTGAAIRDIIQVIGRRNPATKVVVVPVLVQGENAAADIVRGIRLVNKWGRADTIIVGRGGGSIEDLWAFNEEIVARAIFESVIPVISAVGHETDFTIADFISDLRAPTPSAAAELAVADENSVKGTVDAYFKRIYLGFNRVYSESLSRANSALQSYGFRRFPDKVFQLQDELLQNTQRLGEAMGSKVSCAANALNLTCASLEALSPVRILKKGYSLNYRADGTLVSSVNDLRTDDEILMSFSDGRAKARVLSVEQGDIENG